MITLHGTCFVFAYVQLTSHQSSQRVIDRSKTVKDRRQTTETLLLLLELLPVLYTDTMWFN